MPIRLLPPQLANQIAAGEVVERPASVVKELVENCLDAGATQIDISIEKGGTKCIRIRDNGIGIAQDELTLALARHATSKIETFDDLHAIMTLGFRGEALASISSVSRLTLTSKTTEQTEARQAYAEGRDMQVTVKPAAHPTGTTVEVLDLFYNTPARRKFLRSDKTEFNHIDEIIKRIALTHAHIGLTLSHNHKLIRQYRAETESHSHRRLTSICGELFAQNAHRVIWSHDDLDLSGWVSDASYSGEMFQYFFINGRVVKDRLLNHAIRQAYQTFFHQELQPSFVLYLALDPEKVDVNVHPTKQEVRFFQTRLVHDFIYHAVLMTLQNAQTSAPLMPDLPNSNSAVTENRAAAGENSLLRSEPTQTYHQKEIQEKQVRTTDPAPVEVIMPTWGTSYKAHQTTPGKTPAQLREERQIYQELTQAPSPPSASLFPEKHALRKEMEALFLQATSHSFGRVLAVVSERYALLESQDQLMLLSLGFAQTLLFKHQLLHQTAETQNALIVPISIAISADEKRACQRYQTILAELNITFALKHAKIELYSVPIVLRQMNWHQLLPRLLDFLAQQDTLTTQYAIDFLEIQSSAATPTWTQGQAIQLIAELERTLPDSVISPPTNLLQKLDLNPAILALAHDYNA